MNRESNIFVAGHRGLVGSAIVRKLRAQGGVKLLLRTRNELDLLNQAAVNRFFEDNQVDEVYLAAARVGGIYANSTRQTDFLYENLVIATNVIHAAAEAGVAKLIFFGSSCIYPRMAPQPIKESSLLTGPLEPTNEGYALAKIAGLKLCELYRRQFGKSFISAMPTNLYGPGDNFSAMSSHVIPGLMRRFHQARESGLREVIVWGTGTPLREFLHVDDLAEASLLLMKVYDEDSTINVGSSEEHTISELAEMMKRAVGYEGTIVFDRSKPDGTPRKILDSSRIAALGWKPSRGLQLGLEETYRWALSEGVFLSDRER
ncbi:MAG TPA: GDP-L-fucose synthase [Thermoanaerobaculia bacterium]|nr:GDP-L-fucose synthase [Thermoanaerobaculia bacterium]